MFNRSLKRRIKSLEEKLGLRYIPKEGKWEDAEHVPQEWDHTFFTSVSKMIKEWREKKEKKKK